MRKRLFLILAALCGFIAASHAAPTDESINYRVMYKWGLINKQAGRVNISTRRVGPDVFSATLTGATEKWADRFYKVRDTLNGSMSVITYEPTFYEKITHEGGDFKHDIIKYEREGDSVRAVCTRMRQKKSSEPLTSSEITLEATGLTLDMLSAFYYMRAMDFDGMEPGQKTELNVFSGKRKELLTITYIGTEDITIDKQAVPTYHIKFRFTGEQGKKTSDDMDAWIGTGLDRIPLKLEGKLVVGKVQCFFTGHGDEVPVAADEGEPEK